jgi:hypothetical protein
VVHYVAAGGVASSVAEPLGREVAVYDTGWVVHSTVSAGMLGKVLEIELIIFILFKLEFTECMGGGLDPTV